MRRLGMSLAILLWGSLAHAQHARPDSKAEHKSKHKDRAKDKDKDKDRDKDKDKASKSDDDDDADDADDADDDHEDADARDDDKAAKAAKAATDASTKVPEVQEISPDEPVPAKPDAPPPAPTPAPVPGATPSVHLTTLDEMTVPKSYLRFGINFFGDVSFALTSPGTPVSSFSIGTLGIRMLGELSSSLDALAEFALETTEATGPLADVEQLAMRWRGGPGELEVGRFHTDLGYWNTAYHHGRWLQMTVERPHVVRFEDDGGLAPVHWVGAAYTIGKKRDPFNVVVGVGNGRGNIVDDVRVTGDTNEAKGLLLKVRVKSGSVETGAGVIYDLIARADATIRPALPGQKLHEIIANAYFVLRSQGPVLIAEGYAFRHQSSSTSQSWMTYGGYAYAGYHVSELLTPYVGGDAIKGADDDPFFTPVPMTGNHDLVEGIAGLRIETSTWSALKIEGHVEHSVASKEDEYEGILNWSFGL